MEFKEFIEVARKTNLITPAQKLLFDNNTLEELEAYHDALDKNRCNMDCTGIECDNCTFKRHFTDVTNCLRIFRKFNDPINYE